MKIVFVSLATQFVMAKSTICTIKLLLIWIYKKLLAGVPEGMICEKARRLHDYLVKNYPGTTADTYVFKTSRGWFEKFKKRNASGIQCGYHGEAASVNQETAEEFMEEFIVTI